MASIRRFRPFAVLVAFAAFAACGGIALSPDAGTASDAGTSNEAGPPVADASTGDDRHDSGGPSQDGEPPLDGAPKDVGPPDTFFPDVPTGEPCAPVAFTPPPQSGLCPGTSVTLSVLGGLPPQGAIYYTTDGTNPNENSLVYTAPIVVVQGTTIRATWLTSLCSANVSVAAYPIGGTLEPWLNVNGSPDTTFQNDFVLNAQDEGELTVCYTLDGTTPTCSAGVCTGTTLTYSGLAQIPINGSVTNPATGQVTVSALACSTASIDNSCVATGTYTLQAGDPTMSNPAPSTTLAADAGAVAPTLQTVTVSSTSPANTVQILTTTNSATPPTCSAGTAYASPSAIPISGTTSIQAVACKPGYLPSATVTFDYAFAP